MNKKQKECSKVEFEAEFKAMSNFTKARWIALFEAVNLIADKADEREVKFDNINIKQPEMERYVEGCGDNICRYLNMEDENARKKRSSNERIRK